jgi:hypothetical protein
LLMFNTKIHYTRPSMPTSRIHIKCNCVLPPRSYYMSQYFEKTISITMSRTNHSMTPINRIYPAKYVESFLMLAASPNHRLVFCTTLVPHTTQLWMKAKSSLILKDQNLFSRPVMNGLEFFLIPNGKT